MKVLVIAACLVNYLDDRGGVHHDVGEIVNVPKKQAEELVGAERVLYVDSKDDPSKAHVNTATAEMLRAAADLNKASDSLKK
jgi:hypothetical protein